MPSDPPPPRAPRREHVHTGGGLRRADPYAWLADTTDPTVVAHLAAERAHYDAVTARLAPARAALLSEMSRRTPVTESSVSWRHGGWVYHTDRGAGKEFGRFVRVPEPDRNVEPVVLLDEDELAPAGGGHVELGVRSVSPDGRLLAYSVDTDGDERYALRFRDLTTGADLGDVVPGVGEGGAWLDDATFLWVEVDAAWRPWRVRRHVLGTGDGAGGPHDPSASDAVVLSEPDERFELSVRRTRSGRFAVLRADSRDTAQEWLLPTGGGDLLAAGPRTPGVELRCDHAPGPDGDRLVAVTDGGHPEFRLVQADVGPGGVGPWRALGPEPAAGERLERVDAFEGHLVVTLRRDGERLLRVHDLDGTVLHELGPDLPAGTIELGPAEEHATSTVLVRTGSYTEPARWSDVDLGTGERREVHREEAPGHDPAAYVSERRWVTARDGVRVPVTLTRSAGTPLDGSAPCLVYAYGAYEAVDEPAYAEWLPSLWDRGVVFAHAHVRGGGELGRGWWQQGRLTAKPTTFTDLVDVADALADGLVDGTRIATRGLSAGGLVQAAVLGLRPDRWAVVVAEVPFVDVVTTMLDASLPLTALEWLEWGDPRDPAAAASMLAWSPYDGVAPPPAGVRRPPVLVTGAVHDTRVLVHEPAKWVAALRDADDAPVLFRVETGVGAHAGPTGRFAALGYEAEVLAVVLDALEVPVEVG